MKRDAREDVLIDPENLEAEWIEQPSIVQYNNDLFAEIQEIKDSLNEKLDYFTAKLDLQIRENPEKYGFSGKITETAIKNKIVVNKKIRQLKQKLNKVEKSLNDVKGVKNSFEHRKKALENLVSMRITGVHAEPKNLLAKLKEKGYAKYSKSQKQGLKKLKRR